MKKFVILSVLLIAGVLQLNAQDQKQKKDPDEKIIVNKKYDDNGDLIQYDSTYVQQWSSDSTFNFSFGNGFPNMIDHSMIDSMLQQFGFSGNFGISPFGDEDFFEQFGDMFSNLPFTDQFDFHNDSTLQLHSGPHGQLPDFFNSPGLDQWQKQFQKQLEQFNEYMPQFQNEEQRKEWEKLREKQQKEMQELMNKWEK